MKRVLIADDALFMRATLKNIVEKNGWTVVGEASNGMEAISKYFELKPDVMTMDITMPEMDGVDALKAIKEVDQEAKIIMISAMGQQNKVKSCVMAGAKFFIIKPFKEDMIMSVLENI